MSGAFGRGDSPDWMREFQAPVAPPSPGGDPYALEDNAPEHTHQSMADPYALDDIASEETKDPLQTKEAKQGVQRDLPECSNRERADEAGAPGNLAPSSDVPDMGESKGEESLRKQKSRKRGEAAADMSKATSEVREGSRGRSRAAKSEAEPSLATEGNLTVEGAKSNGRRRGGASGAENVLEEGGQTEGFRSAASKKGTRKGKGTASMAGVIDLDSDEEPPPLATQQSTADRTPAPSKPPNKTPSKSLSKIPLTKETRKGQNQENKTQEIHHTKDVNLNGLDNAQLDSHESSKAQNRTGPEDPYALPPEIEVEATRPLTLSPAARLGLKRGPKTSGVSGGLADGGAEAAKPEPEQGPGVAADNRELGNEKKNVSQEGPIRSGVAEGLSRKRPADRRSPLQQGLDAGRGVKRSLEEGLGDLAGEEAFPQGGHFGDSNGPDAHQRDQGTAEEVRLDSGDRAGVNGPGDALAPEEVGKGGKRKAASDSVNRLGKREAKKRAKTSYREESGSEGRKAGSSNDGDDSLTLVDRMRKGKAKVRDTADELEVGREAATAIDEKEGSGAAGLRKSGGLVLNGSEKKVVSPSKRRKSGALQEDLVLDEAPTQATAVPTQEVGPERKGKPRAASTLPLVLPDKVHRTKVLVECEGEGENALDLSGDVGAVGRFSVLKKPGGEGENMFLDLKGVMHHATIVPSTTFMVVNLGPTEAKVEAIMNDFVQLREETNVFQTETTIEGTLDDFDFGEGANDERPGKTTGQEAGPGEGNHADGAAKGTKRKAARESEGEPRAKGRNGGAAKKKPSKSGVKAKAKPKASAKPRKPAKAAVDKAKKSKKS